MAIFFSSMALKYSNNNSDSDSKNGAEFVNSDYQTKLLLIVQLSKPLKFGAN